ncbi:hypothetical protein MT1_0430 [Pseudomonas sp. MT-1]|nr:hypothetical protein MT1_0430 [Pseudomonas sp. MT-1]
MQLVRTQSRLTHAHLLNEPYHLLIFTKALVRRPVVLVISLAAHAHKPASPANAQVFRQYEGCVGNPNAFPFSFPNIGADEIVSTGVSTGEHAVIVVSYVIGEQADEMVVWRCLAEAQVFG